MAELLTRDGFREAVLQRDGYKCVMCDYSGQLDAHHIIDRSLWDNSGYYLSNGVSVCPEHHLAAERTSLSCEDLRRAANISEVLLPEHFYTDQKYDHWGNIVLPSGERIKGELFYQENVQRVLGEVGLLDRFLKYVKYPRTYHLSYSPNLQNDDRQHEDESFFQSKDVIVTAKMDGENSTLYSDYYHARSLDSKHHPSRDWLKALHGRISHDIPEGYRVCGENLYAEHSIHYEYLPSYFLVFSIWDPNNFCLSWHETEEWVEILGLVTVPMIYRGKWNREQIQEAFEAYVQRSRDEVEGYVVRISSGFPYGQYRRHVAKYVRKNHVQTDQFWMTKPVIPNELT